MSDFLQRVCVIDVETTGRSAGWDRVVEVGIAVFESTRWVHRESHLVNPERSWNSDQLPHGIVPEWIENAELWPEVYNKIAPWLYGATPVGYFAPFDLRFLQTAVAYAWPRSTFSHLPPPLMLDACWIDVCSLARGLVTTADGRHNLASVGQALGFDVSGAHRAGFDAHLTGSVLLKMMNDHPGLDWNYAATIARQRQFEARFQREHRFWDRRRDVLNLEADELWLDRHETVQILECDVCHGMAPARFTTNGWTLPEGWGYYASSGERRLVCGSACEGIMAWHAGQRVIAIE